ncbi:fungal-specific transcription factor domain-containing protein [Lipomyces chichibuensis]|uniref:fungal-specific transcription factor domain-containing protein n=1 Tax=Lipomyces chichibuensis TaxID=1546026 RepID=UPI0033439A49
MVTRQPSESEPKSDIFVYESATAPGSTNTDDKSTQNPTGATKRTARACVRCRKQKLKCDSYRPCALCVRANVVCVSRPDGPSEGKKVDGAGSPAPQNTQSVQTNTKYISAPTTLTVGLPPLASLTESMSIGLPPPQSTIISQELQDSRPVKLRRLYPEPADSTTYGSGASDEPRSSSFRNRDDLSATTLNFPSSRAYVNFSGYPDKAVPSIITQEVQYTHKSDSSLPFLSQLTANSGIDALLNRRSLSPAGPPSLASVPSNNSAPSDGESHSSLPWTHTRSSTSSILAHLPPRPIMDYTIAVYFNSVQWFLFVVHEGQFLEQYNVLMAAYEADPLGVPDTDEDFTFAILLIMVIVLGGRYIVVHPGRRKRLGKIYEEYMQHRSPGPLQAPYDLEKAMAQLIALSRKHLLDTLSCCTLSTVQTCILLGSFCLYHGDPNLAWSIFGSGLKSAQAIGLHRNDFGLKEEKRQLRRRVFWALYNYDRFAAMSYGRPLGIHDDDCDVELPTVVNAYPSHGKSSYLMVEDDVKESAGHEVAATLLTYQVCKLQFYIILGEIISKLYRQGPRGIAKHAKEFERTESESDRSAPAAHMSVDYLVSTIQSLEVKLKQWYDQVPDVLKLRDDGSQTPNESTDGEDEDDIIIPDYDDANSDSVSVKARRARIKRDIFSMQAVLLQVQFDNAMIILHRPLLAFQHPPQSPLWNLSSADPFSQSANACWQAALRTSRLASHSAFTKVQYGHGVAFVGIQLFTAGVLLSVFGSSEPLSQRALESKRGLSRIIQMQKALKVKIIVADQGFRILENLARVVVQKEMEKILSGGPYADHNHVNTDSLETVAKDDDDRSAAVMLTRLSYHLNGRDSSANDKSPQTLDAVENQTFNESLLNLERGELSEM